MDKMQSEAGQKLLFTNDKARSDILVYVDLAADLPLEDTRRVIVAALHTIASSALHDRTAYVYLTEKQIRVLALRCYPHPLTVFSPTATPPHPLVDGNWRLTANNTVH